MIFIALNIVFLLFVFTGIGLLFPWNVYARDRRFESLLVCFWIGWAAAIAFLQVWHFFFPVGLGAFLLLLTLSAGGWFKLRGAVAETVRGWSRLHALLLAGLALIPLAMVSNHVMFTTPNSDYALYHLQTVKWFSEYAIVPGLGNLYFPLAFNSSSFLYTAAIDSGLLEGRAFYVSNSLLSFAAILLCASGLYGLLQRGEVKNSHLFNALMIPVVLYQVSTAYIVAYSPDPVVFFLQVIIAAELLRLFEDKADRDQYMRRSMQIVLLAVAGISVKMSFSVFGALALLLVILVGLQRFQLLPWRSPRLWFGWAGLGVAFMLPWFFRNALMSGYLLFPSTTIALPVPWRIPPVLANEVQTVIRMWALTVNASLDYTADMAWFLNWWNYFPFFARQTFIFTLILAALSLIVLAVLRKQIRPDPAPAALALICIPALIFWFIMAPFYRFSGALLWIFFAAVLVFGFRMLIDARLVNRPELLAYTLVLVVSLWLSPNYFSNNLSRRLILIPPLEQVRAEQIVSRSRLQHWTTNDGMQVNIPPDGIQECWDAPLPCTTAEDFSVRLRQIQPGSLQKGFIRDVK
jgi:hypothetical protein